MGFWWGRGDRLRFHFGILDQKVVFSSHQGGLVEIGAEGVTFTNIKSLNAQALPKRLCQRRIGYCKWFESLFWIPLSIIQLYNSFPINSTLVTWDSDIFLAQDMYALQDFKSSPAETIKAALAAGTDVACSPGVRFYGSFIIQGSKSCEVHMKENLLRKTGTEL